MRLELERNVTNFLVLICCCCFGPSDRSDSIYCKMNTTSSTTSPLKTIHWKIWSGLPVVAVRIRLQKEEGERGGRNPSFHPFFLAISSCSVCLSVCQPFDLQSSRPCYQKQLNLSGVGRERRRETVSEGELLSLVAYFSMEITDRFHFSQGQRYRDGLKGGP